MENQEKIKELYRAEAVRTKTSGQTLLHIFIAAVLIMAVFAVARFLPASWIFEIGAIVAGAVYINKILKEGTFKKTYILYENSLVVITKYGLIEKITAEYDLEKTQFTEKTVTFNGKTEPFSPDNELKKLLNL